ncbi:SsrA-binding protein SmpB [Mycoplasma todarodis]|uniref:SsrA-binding protein n=1 Tax=Mycoplasma todarodis TaxID=1937191 RepID=A0A4V2NI65_9MOLU|nr:SsrA-binding protein SmpB [Mycoplasma todarodis]TCG11168.1 SsrA-binding protein [Mycoplasma todarodis]
MAKVIAKNKDAHYSYELSERIEAGIELMGWEVKSIRAGKVSLRGAFVNFTDDEAYLMGMNISQYMAVPGDELRSRKLLLHKHQLKKLQNGVKTKGMSIVATTLKWSNNGYVKVDVALGKGKSRIDKRETIKERDISRKIKKQYNV